MASEDYNILRVVPSYHSGSDNTPLITRVQFLNNVPVLVNITGGPVNFFGFNIYNPNGYDVFVKCYDSVAPTVGTTEPVLTFHVPTMGSIFEVGTNLIYRFATTMSIAVVQEYQYAGTSAVGSGVLTQIYWKG